ncbi:MAG: sulfatase-like hydrolase/transferase [Proteobacteria bacterium]|nr:sulfatase-like hydrolase/transferase [Pseudomonadota bacterium]
MTRGTRRLIWIAASFLLISLTTRTGLAIFSDGSFAVVDWGRFLGIGLVFDLTVLPWFLMPWTIYDAVTPEFPQTHRLHIWESRWAATWASLFLGLFAVVTAAEFAFWAEFGSRFDFIAVDYLVYTHEVIGNIRQSYPVNFWIMGIVVASLVVTWFSWPRHAGQARPALIARWGRVAGAMVWAALGVALVNVSMADTKSSAQVRQLSINGLYALFHAYRHNQLDYDKYYPTLAAADLNSEIRSLVHQGNAKFAKADGIERKITAATALRKVNVVLISVESLSAEFLGHFGNKEGITPELDKLADQGLFFTNLYATGTRTVRGLEALTVGTPPTPGQSIVRRPDNQDLENLGEELEENGWKPYWIYGGYGLFDNMNAYFKANKYTVVDRSDMDTEGRGLSR